MTYKSFKTIQSVISLIISVSWYFSAVNHNYLWIVLTAVGIWQIITIKWIISHIEDSLAISTTLMEIAGQVSNSIVVQMIWIYSKLVNWFAVGSIWICSFAASQYNNWIMQYTSISLMIVATLLTGIKLGFLIRKLHHKAMSAAVLIMALSMISCSVGPNSDDLEDYRAQVSTSIRYQAEMANEDYDCGIEDNWLDVMQSKLDSMSSIESMDSLKSSYEKEIHEMIEFQKDHGNDPME